MLDANIYVFGLSSFIHNPRISAYSWPFLGSESETKFGVNVRQKERLLRKGLVIYIGAASEFTGLHCSHLSLVQYAYCQGRAGAYSRLLPRYTHSTT